MWLYDIWSDALLTQSLFQEGLYWVCNIRNLT